MPPLGVDGDGRTDAQHRLALLVDDDGAAGAVRLQALHPRRALELPLEAPRRRLILQEPQRLDEVVARHDEAIGGLVLLCIHGPCAVALQPGRRLRLHRLQLHRRGAQLQLQRAGRGGRQGHRQTSLEAGRQRQRRRRLSRRLPRQQPVGRQLLGQPHVLRCQHLHGPHPLQGRDGFRRSRRGDGSAFQRQQADGPQAQHPPGRQLLFHDDPLTVVSSTVAFWAPSYLRAGWRGNSVQRDGGRHHSRAASLSGGARWSAGR